MEQDAFDLSFAGLLGPAAVTTPAGGASDCLMDAGVLTPEGRSAAPYQPLQAR